MTAKLHPKRKILDAQQMTRVIRRMANEIVAENEGVETLLLVGIRTRGVPLAEKLAKEIQQAEGEVEMGILDITLYRDDLSTVAAHPIVKETRFPSSIEGKTVVLCDDVLYTGRTIRAAMDALVDYGRPRAVRLAVLIDRGFRELPIQADVVGQVVQTVPEEVVEVRFAATDDLDEVEVMELVEA